MKPTVSKLKVAALKGGVKPTGAKKVLVAGVAKLEPVPAKYAGLGESLAREMMASDKRDLLGKAKKALGKGTVTGKGDIQRSTSTPSTKGGPGYTGIGGKKA